MIMAARLTDKQFQSTLPVRGATCDVCGTELQTKISIHAPREGSDQANAITTVWGSCISIHAPREGSDSQRTSDSGPIQISIHAPREGSDKNTHALALRKVGFQSTLPVRGATQCRL